MWTKCGSRAAFTGMAADSVGDNPGLGWQSCTQYFLVTDKVKEFLRGESKIEILGSLVLI